MTALAFIGRMVAYWLLASLVTGALVALVGWAKRRRRKRDLLHLAELAAARREEERRKEQERWRELARARRFGDLVVESRQGRG